MSTLIEYYDACFTTHGDTAQGAGWPDQGNRLVRFDVALDLVELIAPDGPLILADIGCGTGELLRRIRDRRLERIGYVGADALDAPLAVARAKFPGSAFHHLDVAVADSAEIGRLSCDVLVANGLFTVKAAMSNGEMWEFMTGVLRRFWPVVRRGVIFNVMSPVVDWEREDLFHVSYDRLAGFLHGVAGRWIGFRADYGLYEYMAYARKPAAAVQSTR